MQQVINNTPIRSTLNSPFKILTRLKIKTKENLDLRIMLEEVALEELNKESDILRDEAQENIVKIQRENKINFEKTECLKEMLGDHCT